jgi:hypothetical protein
MKIRVSFLALLLAIGSLFGLASCATDGTVTTPPTTQSTGTNIQSNPPSPSGQPGYGGRRF